MQIKMQKSAPKCAFCLFESCLKWFDEASLRLKWLTKSNNVKPCQTTFKPCPTIKKSAPKCAFCLLRVLRVVLLSADLPQVLAHGFATIGAVLLLQTKRHSKPRRKHTALRSSTPPIAAGYSAKAGCTTTRARNKSIGRMICNAASPRPVQMGVGACCFKETLSP